MYRYLFSILCLVLLSACYTVKEETLISKVRYPGTETKVGENYLVVKQVEQPTIDNPYQTVELSKASKYRYQKSEKYSRYLDKNPAGMVAGAVVCSGLGGLLFANHTDWIKPDPNSNDEASKPEAFLAGAGIGILAWWLVSVVFKDNKHVYIDKPGFEFDYKTDEILANTEIQIIQDKLEKTYVSDAKGLIKFSPPFDFQLKELKTPDSILFYFKKNGLSFDNAIRLHPSEWMDQYARITVPKTLIGTQTNYEDLGYAREGMLYRVIGKDTGRINIEIGSKSGWIDAKHAETSYTMKTTSDFTPAIKGYVTEEMQKWIQQGEFELPDEYLQRMAKKDEQLLALTNQAMKTFQREYVKAFDWDKSTLSIYDPNSQTFKVNIPGLKEVVLAVPIGNAKDFKNNWESAVFKNQEFTMIDGKWELASFEIEDSKQSYTAKYDSQIRNNYDPLNQFAFDLKDFTPDLSKLPNNQINKPINENLDEENYQINVNLPKTQMKQPDAIAVVIGNAFYQKTQPVNYALNDAQLMKLYLTQTLGYKEGNIIFVMNASKAEFEGLFGTDNNYKGKLFNYIKPGVSDVFIFYSGHGAPDVQTGEAYFVPTDCDPAYIELQGYALKTFYGNLAKLPAKSTTIVIDACFSGAGVINNISSVRIKPKETENDIPNSTILSSSGGDQVSSWYNDMKHGMFTYFFLKAIHDYKNSDKNGDKELKFSEIYEYVSDKTNGVPYFARRLNAVEQTPVLKGSNTDKVFIKYVE